MRRAHRRRSLLGALALCAGACSAAEQGAWTTVSGEGVTTSDLEHPFVRDRVVELRLEMPAETWLRIKANALSETYERADLVFDGVRLDDVAVRTKGNSSLRFVVEMGSERFAFKIDTDHYVDGQELLGVDKLNLNNGFKDPTLMREHLGYDLMRALGLPAPRTAFVDLWVADQHLGLYTLAEQVDGEFLRANFEDTSGDLYKAEPPAGALGYLGDDFSAYAGMELKRNEETSDHAAFLRLIAELDHGAAERYDSVLDVDAVLRYLAASAALVNLDSYLGMGHNYYLYEQQPGRFVLIPWDLNEAFGSFRCGCDRAGVVELRVDEPTCGGLAGYPLVERLLAVPALRDAYHAHLEALLAGPFALAALRAQIEEIAALIRPYVEADPTSFFSAAEFEAGLTRDVPHRMGEIIGLETFVEERGAALRAQLDGDLPTLIDGAGSCPGNQPPDGPPPDGPCGDGVCDDFEQANPTLCPLDCSTP